MLSKEEQRIQLTFSSLMPSARLAANFRVPLKEMKRLIELAYYQESKRRDMKMKEVRALLSISMSKVGLLSKQLKEHFAQPTEEFGLPRMIMKLLWSGPLSEVRIAQAFEDVPAKDIAETLAGLVAQKRVVEVPGRTVRFKLGEPQYRLVQDPWMARVDALNNLMLSTVQAIEARFLKGDAESAFARTLSFRVRESDLPRLKALYEEHIFKLVCELDEIATEGGEGRTIPVNLSVVWAPDADWSEENEEEERET